MVTRNMLIENNLNLIFINNEPNITNVQRYSSYSANLENYRKNADGGQVYIHNSF